MMKRWLFLLLLPILLLTACRGNVEKHSEHFSLPAYGITLLTPKGWEAKPTASYDLYVSSASGSVYLGLTAFTGADLAEGETPAELFDRQVEAVLAQRNRSVDLRARKTETHADRIIHSRVCAVSAYDSTYGHYFALVEFADSDRMAWVFAVSSVSYAEKNASAFDSMMMEIRAGEATEAPKPDKMTPVKIPTQSLTVSAPQSWSKTGSKEVDLQLGCADNYVSVMVYSKAELGSDVTVVQLFDALHTSMVKDRSNVVTLKDKSAYGTTDQILHTVTYTAETDGVKHGYYLTLVELRESDELVWICISGRPSFIERYHRELQAIAESVDVA